MDLNPLKKKINEILERKIRLGNGSSKFPTLYKWLDNHGQTQLVPVPPILLLYLVFLDMIVVIFYELEQ